MRAEISNETLLAMAKNIKAQLELFESIIESLEKKEEWMTLREVKEEIPGISTRRLNMLAASSVIETRKLSPRRTLYKRSSVEYLKTGKK